MQMKQLLTGPALLLVVAVTLTGCTRRQLVPGLIAGTGAILTTSGGIYRATLDTDEPFGDTSGEVAGTTVLIFGGIGLLITGIVWSITSNHCEDNGDCWSGDVCEVRTHTCIDGEAARQVDARQARDDEEGDEEDAVTSADESEDDGGDDSEGEEEPRSSDSDTEEEEEEYVPPPYPG